MKRRASLKAILIAATISLSSITVLATEDKVTDIEITEITQNVNEDVINEIQIIEEKEESEITEETVEVKEEESKSKGEEIIEYAKQFIGTPYVYAGNSLTKGVDCSGFTSQVFKNFDISLKRRSADQYSSNGTKVKKADLEAGDLVFYGYSSVTHVGIYMGDNQVIHASTTHGVKIDPLNLRGMPPIMGYKRVL